MIIKTEWIGTVDVPSLEHSANYTCGGITGHTRDCPRTESGCVRIIHRECSPNTAHPLERIEWA